MTYKEWSREYNREYNRQLRKRKIERRYYLKQKLSGIAIILVGIGSFLIDRDITFCLFAFPFGLYLIFTKEKAMMYRGFEDDRE